MTLKFRWITCLSLGLWACLPLLGVAQLVVYPIGVPDDPSRIRPLGLSMNDTLTLPFFDDFSAEGPLPNPLWWTPNSRVWVNRTMAINPLSLGTATFDGAKPDGRPYVEDAQPTGFGDSLMSKPINILQIPQNQRSTIVLSFFWQKQGRGEIPDQNDVLQLLFKRANGNWDVVWQVNGLAEVPTTTFQFESIALSNPAYHHAGFQFLFRSAANLGGPFDTWNLDYVWMDAQRRVNNPASKDRSISALPEGGFFGEYTHIPAQWLRNKEIGSLDTLQMVINNLDSLLQPLEYDLNLTIKGIDTLRQIIHDGEVVEPIVQGREQRTIPIFPFNPSLLPQGDSLLLEFFFRLQSGDEFYRRTDGTVFPHVSFAANDTLSFRLLLEKTLAYDDGTAEFSIGIAQNGGRVAYAFQVDEPDVIEALDIHFPFIPGGQVNRRMELLIYSELANGNQGILTMHPINIPEYAGRDVFTRIKLPRPAFVEGTFYIGWQHIGNLPVAVGLDKSRTLSNKVFTNTRGTWEAVTDVGGLLMLRPVLNKGVVAAALPPADLHWQLYPNPAIDVLYLQGLKSGQYQIINVLGQNVRSGQIFPETAIDISGLSQGMYILRVVDQGFVQSKKFIKR